MRRGEECRAEDEYRSHHPGVPDAAEVFLRYSPRIHSLARRMLQNEADADDVVQDVLVQVVRKLNTFRGECELTTWLDRVTVNAALLHRSKRATRAAREAHIPLDDIADHGRPASAAQADRSLPDRQAQARELRELIGRAIARLPKAYQDAAVLSGLEGRPNAEVGQALGLSLPAVKSRLHRARLLLRRALAPYFCEALPA
jgi:RNA polymerase sigma-70 factor (ECF subfamily)